MPSHSNGFSNLLNRPISLTHTSTISVCVQDKCRSVCYSKGLMISVGVRTRGEKIKMTQRFSTSLHLSLTLTPPPNLVSAFHCPFLYFFPLSSSSSSSLPNSRNVRLGGVHPQSVCQSARRGPHFHKRCVFSEANMFIGAGAHEDGTRPVPAQQSRTHAFQPKWGM